MTTPDTTIPTHVDALIVGGGAAGLAAAVALARSLRSVLVVDAGHPRNAPADGAHNLLGREGISPLDLLRLGRDEARGYGAHIVEGTVTSVTRSSVDGDVGFVARTAAGDEITARRLLLAGGLVDELPDIPGMAERWGRDVLHCPYCHGYEVRGARIGILGTGPMAMHQTLLFSQLSDHITVIDQGMPTPSADERAQLAALGIEVVAGPVVRLDSTDGRLRGAVLGDGREIGLDALVVGPRMVARDGLYESLGGTLQENPMGTVIPTEFGGRTPVDGVFAAGNAADLVAQIGASAAAGVQAGALINADLIQADVRRRVLATAG
jgi:thioredoxin reductase